MPNGGSLYYEVIDRVAPWEQKRDPILFHHGIGASAGIWTEWIAALADRHPIVTFDMRGYGRSMIPPPDFRWSLDLFIADVFAVADAASLKRFHLVGELIGGTIGAGGDAGAAGAHRDTDRQQWRRISAPRSSASMNGGASSRKAASKSGPTSSCATASMTTRSRPSAGPGSRRSRKPGRRIRSSAPWPYWSGPTSRRNCRRFGCPVLLLHPDGSPFIPVAVAAEMHRLLPNARLNVFGPARHGLPFSHGAQCAALLRSFLDRPHRG